MTYKVYILYSEEFYKHYVGQTVSLEERVELHNSPRARWTKRFQPWVLIHYEEYATRAEAMAREKYLKSLKNIKRYLEKLKT